MEKYVYLGPYIKIKEEKVIETINEKSCDDESCILHGKKRLSNFCSYCGKPLTLKSVGTKEKTKGTYQILDKFDNPDKLSPILDDIFICNQENNYTKWDIDTGDVPITDLDVLQAIAMFKIDHENEIKKLDDIGIEYQILYGVVSNYN